MNLLARLEQKAKEMVESVSNHPQGRYDMRFQFYQKYGDPWKDGNEGLGNSELAFIKWEIRRGTLNSIDAPNPGSRWWRMVNSHFLYVATLAQLITESGETFEGLLVPVNKWLDYINEPNECTWYRAHNSSIISGYQVANEIAFEKNVYEQYFMNIVLYRVLYAQSMVEGVSFGVLGKIFANPRGEAVSLITDIEAFYPSHYPLTKQDIKYVTHRAHNLTGTLEDVFDLLFIIPHLNKLYEEAAKWNDSPQVTQFVKGHKPIYPIGERDENASHFLDVFTTHEIQIPNA